MDEEDSCWKQMERRLQQEGYREGAAKGRQESFQQGFDEGYTEGFRIAQLMGEVQGILRYNESVQSIPSPPLLQKMTKDSTKGACKLCEKTDSSKTKSALPDEVYEVPFSQIVFDQSEHNDRLTSEISTLLKEYQGNRTSD